MIVALDAFSFLGTSIEGLSKFAEYFESFFETLFAWFEGVASFFLTVPGLFSGLPVPVQALLTFGVSGIMVGIVLRII